MSYGHWGEYVTVAARRAQAEREVVRLRKAGRQTSPVKIEGRAIATSFWGKAWCANLEAYQDYENRLPRGRTYVRNGSVVDLNIAPSSITAMVMGSSMYRVSVVISPLPATRWAALCKQCAGGIDSMIELLQGRFSENVMERMCHRESGLFPKPSEIKLSCSCPDYSEMCKHVAAALYGVGARLDSQPDLLFRLRSVDEKALVGRYNTSLSFLTTDAPKNVVLSVTDLSALFGLDIAKTEAALVFGKQASPKTPMKSRATGSSAPPATTVSARQNVPALKAPAARSTDKTPLTFNRKAKQVRDSKKPEIIVESARHSTGHEPSARSDTRGVTTKAAAKQITRTKTGRQPVSKRRTRLSRSKPA